ncbi:protein-disulfide reductase DsbD family protein [Vibrio lentus]|nr:protein-disulfide reductase DsbD family protein [Vibrio lentus]
MLKKTSSFPVEKAFPVTWEATDQGAVISFDTHKVTTCINFDFRSKGESSLSTLEPSYSLLGEEKEDLTLQRHRVSRALRYRYCSLLEVAKLTVRYQGCADKGLCYLPQKVSARFTHARNRIEALVEEPSNSLYQTLGEISEDTNVFIFVPISSR